MDLISDINMDRSPLREYTTNFVDEKDEQEYAKDGMTLWQWGLTTNLTHWQLDKDASVADDLFDEYSSEIYGNPFIVKGRLAIDPSEDLMKEIGTARDLDGIITVHKGLFDGREIAVTDLFSYKGQFYKINSIDADNLFREHHLFIQFGAYIRNTPDFVAGIGQDIIINGDY